MNIPTNGQQQFGLNNFNDFIAQASSALMCDSDCQNNKHAEKLEQKFLKAQQTLVAAPDRLQQAEKNFITFTKGQETYDELHEEQLTAAGQEIADQFAMAFVNEGNVANEQINSYASLLINYNNVKDLYTKYKRENAYLARQLKETSNVVLTSERQTFYENQQINDLNYYYRYFFWTIYSICVLAFAILAVIYKTQQYSVIVRVIAFVGLCVLPYIATWALSWIIWAVYELYELLPKNIYR